MKMDERLLCAALLIGVLLLPLTPVFKVSASPDGLPLEIETVILRDEDGNPITQIKRGRFIFVDIVLKNVETYAQTSQPYLAVARLTYGTGLMGLGAYKGSLAPGEKANPMPGLQIPSGGSTGLYKVKVMVSSDWPALGGLVVAEPVEVTLTVTS